MKLSFIIPVYNKADELCRCLDSIIAQMQDDIEIIIIDDNSEDASLSIEKKYEGAYDNVHVHKNKTNHGAGFSRNLGIKKATGEYIWFVDADDSIAPNAINYLLEVVYKYLPEVLYFDVERITDVDRFATPMMPFNTDSSVMGEDLYHMFCQNGSERAGVWGQLYLAKYLEENGLRFREGVVCEDLYFSMSALLGAKSAQYIRFTGYNYYKVKKSVTIETTHINMFKGCITAYCDVYDCLYKRTTNRMIKMEILKQALKYHQYAYNHLLMEDVHSIVKWAEELEPNILEEVRNVIMKKCAQRRFADFSHDELRRLSEATDVIVFGDGEVALELAEYINELDIPVKAYMVSDNAQYKKRSIYGVSVFRIRELKEYAPDGIVIIALIQKRAQKAKELLIKHGFKNILLLKYENRYSMLE